MNWESKARERFRCRRNKDGVLCDLGYLCFDFIDYLESHYVGFYLFRCTASSSFPAVEHFAQSGAREAVIWLDPSNTYL